MAGLQGGEAGLQRGVTGLQGGMAGLQGGVAGRVVPDSCVVSKKKIGCEYQGYESSQSRIKLIVI